MTQTAQDLRAARALIDRPEKWIKGANVRGGCFCSFGAIRRAVCGTDTAERHDMPRINAAVDALAPALDGSFITHWNDAPKRTHAEILDAFDRAIALAESTP